MVFWPYMPLALLAAARPPEPIPMTRKSHSLGVGAMIAGVVEKWRDRVAVLDTACLVDAAEAEMKREVMNEDSLSDERR